MDLIYKLNADHRVDGLLVQLPLPGTEKVEQWNRKINNEYRESCICTVAALCHGMCCCCQPTAHTVIQSSRGMCCVRQPRQTSYTLK